MTRKIKGLSLALVAIAAMSMAVAAGAQATQLHANTPQSASLFAHQHQLNIFTTNAGTIGCSQATLEGTVTHAPQITQQVTADDLQLRPTYSGCQAFGQQMTVDMNGCQFTITGTQVTGVTYSAKTAVLDITGCTTNQDITHKKIEITTGICRMTVPEQHHLSHIIFTQSGIDLTAEITIAGITYQADGPLCPGMPSSQTLTNGAYHGAWTVKATEDKGSVQVTKHNHQYPEFLQTGSQVALQVT